MEREVSWALEVSEVEEGYLKWWVGVGAGRGPWWSGVGVGGDGLMGSSTLLLVVSYVCWVACKSVRKGVEGWVELR